MATEIINNTGGIVTLPPNLGSFILGAGKAVVVGYTEVEVVAILSAGNGFPAGLNLRTVPNTQVVQPVSAIANDFLPSIKSRGNNTPPVAPAVGDRYIIGTSPTGAWAGHANQIVQWSGSTWIFTAPTMGAQTFDEDTSENVVFDGAAWAPIGGGGGGVITVVGQATTSNLDIVVDYANGYDGPAPNEIVFHSQAEIDAYLLSKGATSFKYITKVWDNSVPQYYFHRVRFLPQSNAVHRPENPLPVGASAAWDFFRKGLPPHFACGTGLLSIYQEGPMGTDYYNTWESLLGDIPVAGYVNSTPDQGITPPSITAVGTPFGADNSLVGYFAITDTYGTPRPIIKNTNNTLWLSSQGGGVPTTVRVTSPSIILRNSYNDTTKVSATTINCINPASSGNPKLNIDSIRIDDMGATGVKLAGMYLDAWGCLFDHARQKNLFGVSSFSGYPLQLEASSDSFVGGQAWICSFRGVYLATVPGGSEQPVMSFLGSRKATSSDSGNLFSWLWSIVGGFVTFGTWSQGAVSFNSTRFGDVSVTAQSHLTLKDMMLKFDVSHMAVPGFQRCSGGIALYGVDWEGSTLNRNQLLFDGQTGNYPMVAFWYDNKTVGGPITLRQGAGANAGKPIYLVGPRNDIQLSVTCDLVGAGGAIEIANSDYFIAASVRSLTYAQLDDLRTIRKPPGGTLAGVVDITNVDAGTALGATASLAYVAVGTTLAYTAPGDAAGTAVNVSGGGFFTLKSANGKAIQVKVEAAGLPGSDTTQTFEITRGYFTWPWTQNRIARRYA